MYNAESVNGYERVARSGKYDMLAYHQPQQDRLRHSIITGSTDEFYVKTGTNIVIIPKTMNEVQFL